MNGSTIACKNCKNTCRLVVSGALSIDPINRIEAYNLWQCDECGSMFREFAGHKRINGSNIIDA